MTAPPSTGRRVTADDWIQAGFDVLAEGGPNALRIGRLCERLDVTKGSFYWHFTDMGAYRTALARAWGNLHDERRRQFEDMRHADPRQRLTVMMQTLVSPDHWALERSMRLWALTDESVLASVQQSDSRVLEAVREALVDYGFDPIEADLRASVLWATGVGLLHEASAPVAQAAPLAERVLDLVLHR
ncbi:TetR/AcrR family transcriptional regulator [Mycolicibacterium phlei]|uniref:TetR/AcrR family transcriptional regulator n=1 Tax=Mycolicibacterium phlei TaxID=1771 RepID=UPI00058D8C7A|nr:TetR/AcrR family transcriptional regulator [Mycolicibacterium phlei]KXW76354.1 TetR family transcriptional regulator [Mycolicibacterium phlei DSM 43071]